MPPKKTTREAEKYVICAGIIKFSSFSPICAKVYVIAHRKAFGNPTRPRSVPGELTTPHHTTPPAMAHPAASLDPADDFPPADGDRPLGVTHIDQRMTDIATVVTQISAQLLSLGRKHEQWFSRFDRRLAAIETQTHRRNKNFARPHRQSRTAPVLPQVISTQEQDSSADVNRPLLQPQPPSREPSAPSSPIVTVKTEPMEVSQSPAFVSSTSPISIPRAHSPPPAHSGLPNGANQRSAGAPLANLVHPQSVEPGPRRLDRNDSQRAPPNKLPWKKAPAFRSAPPTMDEPERQSERQSERPSMRVSDTLTAAPLGVTNANTNELDAPSSNRDAQPSTTQPAVANVLNSKNGRHDGGDDSRDSHVPSTESPFPTGDWPTETALSEPIPDWLPVAGAENSENDVQAQKTQALEGASSGRAQEVTPAAEQGSTTFAVTFEAAPVEESSRDRLQRVSTDIGERAAALTACVPALVFRDQDLADDDPRPREQTSSPEPDVCLPSRRESGANRAKNLDRDASHRLPAKSNGVIAEPEVIVISDDDDGDEALPIRSNSQANGDAPEIKEEPTANQLEIMPEGGQHTTSQRDDSVTTKPSGKRKRVNYPYTNSISQRNLRRELDFEASDHSSDDEEDMSVDGDPDDDLGNHGLVDYSSSGDPDFTPSRTQASGASSARRPLKVPRLATPMTVADTKAQVRQADEIRKTFFHEDGGNPKHALELYESAGNHNNVTGMVRAAAMLSTGAVSRGPGTTKLRKNIKRAMFWVNKALRADPDFTEALNLRGDLWLVSKVKRGKAYKCALDLYAKAAQLGDIGGVYRIGRLWHTQMQNATTKARKRKCCKNAIKELTKAVEGGSALAASLLGSIYENDGQDDDIAIVISESEGGDNPVKKATELYWLSMDRGSAQGTNDVAACYEVAYGDVIGNFDLAKELYEQAFKMGYLGAAANLALLYELGGKGCFMDRISGDEAFKWYNIGHSMGCPVATYYLGSVYDNGSIADRNPRLAERLIVAAINFAEDSGKDLDIIGRAANDLLGIYATKVLMNTDGAEQARKDIWARFGKTAGNHRLASLRKDFAIIVAASVDGNLSHADMVTLQSARESVKEVIGQRNYEAIMRRAKIILQDIRVRRLKSADVSTDVAYLLHIVGEFGIAKLGLES